MQIRNTSSRGIDYLVADLHEGPKSLTRAILWRIPHRSPETEDICLKLGRYKSLKGNPGEVDETNPRSELTLTDVEFRNLIAFLEQNYEPFRMGVAQWIAVDQPMSDREATFVRQIFTRTDLPQVVDFVLEHDVVSDEMYAILQQRVRERAVSEFREMLQGNLVEQDWQDWFTTNDWILGTDIVRIIDDRRIDVGHIADYLVEGHDGFLDLVEIKRPEGDLRFWAEVRDHGNFVPATGLVKAITQTLNYLHEIESETDSLSFRRRLGIPAVKPRATLIYGRSDSWGEEERVAYRVLNRSFHSLSILTFDHVLARAERVLISPEAATDPDDPVQDGFE